MDSRAAFGRVAVALAAAVALGGILLAQDPPRPLTILATGQSLGALEPCDCVEGMLGGFPRRLAVVRRARKAGPVLLVDGGDLTGKALHPGLLTAKTRASLDLMREAGVAAAGVGERDLRLGVAPLLRLAREAGVSLLGANLLRDGAPAFPASTLITVGGRRVLVIGVLDPDLGDPTGVLTLTDPAQAVRAAISAAPPRDLTVVLFHGEAEAALTRLAKVQADVVICGHDALQASALRKVGGAHLVETLRDARSISRLRLDAEPSLDLVALDGFVPDDPRARARIDRYYEEIRGLPAQPRRQTQGGRYAGSTGCKDCHQAATQAFVGSKHHQAYVRVLAAKPKQASLPGCVSCHVTGLGFVSGFRDMQATPELGEIGCEVCHGVGGNHAARGVGRGYGLRPGFPGSWKPLCTGCHDSTNSPGFDFEKALKAIEHWKPR